mmetsp:Transcript_30772/g.56349  ORF Transcript_30772/g.56349 Transcript_30772/m.56349 type:complete len:350 (+) Transcript_30772:161-1210(+)
MKAKHISAVLGITLNSSTAISKSLCSKPHDGEFPSDRFDVPFKSMVVFGDSFSDIGNINIASNKTQPGIWSYAGRYSDGRVWQEYVAQFLGLPSPEPSQAGGKVFAWGGATTNNDYVSAFSTALDAVVPAVDQQITEYVDGTLGVDEDALHVVFSGYNDYWWYVFRNFTTTTGQDLNMTNVYTTVAREVLTQVRRLYDAGSRHFLVGNVPNMTSWAEAQGQSQEVLNAYRTLALGHNNLLLALLSEFEQSTTDTTVYKLDYFDSMDCLNEREDFLGFRDLIDACHSQDQNCGNVFSYKFWDEYHPTTHSHFVLSRAAIQTIFEKEKEAIKTVKAAESMLARSFLRSSAS